MVEIFAAEQKRSKRRRVVNPVVQDDNGAFPNLDESERRKIRMHYREIKNRIHEEKDELFNPTSGKILSILNEVNNLHKQVTRTREQVSDAEALLCLAATFSDSVKSHGHGGVTPGDFMSSLIRQFDKRKGLVGISRDTPDISWVDIGSLVSPIVRKEPRCMSMIGPMTIEVKARRPYTRRKRTVPVEKAIPETIDEASKVPSDTNENAEVIFKILRKKYKQKVDVKLENLILNRSSFAQTVENLFALSFLVKDGNVIININEDGSHIVVPSNRPSAGETEEHQFIFRFDFADWKLMKDLVVEGEELMPCRDVNASIGDDKAKAGFHDEGIHIPEAVPLNSQTISTVKATPIDSQTLSSIPAKKFSRNYGSGLDKAKAGLHDEDVHIPEAVPLNSQTISTVKATSVDSQTLSSISAKTFSRNYGSGHDNAKDGLHDEGIHIPEAIPLNFQAIGTVKVTPFDSETLNTTALKKASRNYGNVNTFSDMTKVVTVASPGNWSSKRKKKRSIF